MTGSAEILERELANDLTTLEERFADDEFSTQLYRALTNNAWSKEGGPEGRVSLSWSRAETFVNELRARQGQDALTLAQTGGEGEISDLIASELGRLGWSADELDTSRRDPAHLTQPESPPPAEQGERDAPTGEEGEWEAIAHEEAEANRPPQRPRRPHGDPSAP